jgi:programmed cell death protein 5
MGDRLPISDLNPSEIPDGFTAADPAGGGGNAPQQKQQQQEQRQAILEQALTPDALARLMRIKLVKAAKVAKVESAIVSMAMSGKLPGRINEGKLIEMLERTSASDNKKVDSQISIQRKRYAMDSDDDDDNDL